VRQRSSVGQATDILQNFFGDDAVVCVGRNVYQGVALRVTDSRLSDPGWQYVVPARVKLPFRRRCNEQFGERAWLVLDFDRGSKDEQSSFIWFLANSPVLLIKGSICIWWSISEAKGCTHGSMRLI